MKTKRAIKKQTPLTPHDLAMQALHLKEVNVTTKAVVAMFDKWLEKNQHRFPYPVVVRQPKTKTWHVHGKQYGFQGLAKEIYFSVWPCTLRTHFDLNGDYYDTMCDFEIYPVKDKKGRYTCRQCASNYQEKLLKTSKKADWLDKIEQEKYFKTLDALYADHCFEGLLKWCKEKLHPENVIIYAGERDGPCAAIIYPASYVLQMTSAHRVLPLVPAKVSRDVHFFTF